MKKKSRPSNKLANLTFYNPREEEFSPDKNSIIEKTQKFYRTGTSKGPLSSKSVTSPQSVIQALHQRKMSQTGGDFFKEMITLEHDASVTAPTVQTVQEGLDLSPIRIMHGNSQSFGISKVYKFSDKSLEKLPSNLRFRDSTDRSLEKTHKEVNRTQEEAEISKIYKSAHIFQNLKFTREKDEIARLKLSEDKASHVSTQLDAVRSDVSHIFNYRPARIKTPSQTFLPDVKERQGTGLSKIFKEAGSGAQTIALDTSSIFEKRHNSVGHTLSSSMGPVTPMKILDNNLQDSKFFIPTSAKGGQKSLLFGALQRDIHSVQSPLSRNAKIQARSSNDRSADKIEYMQTTMTAFDTGEYSPFQSLKKEIPSAFTSAPANRQELVQLGTWLNSTLKGIKENNGYTEKEKFYKADEIYNICFNELIRQVSVECMERGELIMVVWKAYLSLAEDIIEDIKLREDKAEERGQKEVEKVHKMYNEILGVKEKLIEDQQNKLNEFDVLVKELNGKIAAFDEKEAVKINEISKLKETLTKAKKNYMHIQQEQRDLQYKYNRLKKNFDQVEDESLPEHFNKQRKESFDFSFSSDSDDKPAREANAFGNPRHKIIRYADACVMYEPPAGLGDVSTQTDLVLASERYDRIFESQKKMENILLDDIAKSKLIQSAEMMENLSDKNKRRSRRDAAKSDKEDVSKNVTAVEDDLTIAEEDFVEGDGEVKNSRSNSLAVRDILTGELHNSLNSGVTGQGSLLISESVGNRNAGRSRASKTKSVTRKDKATESAKETSRDIENAEEGEEEEEGIAEEKEGEPKKGREKGSKSIERAKGKKESAKVQGSSPSKEARPSVISQNRSTAKKETEKVEASNKPKTVKSNVAQRSSGAAKRISKIGGRPRAEGEEDAIEDEKEGEDGRGTAIYEIKLTEEITITERDAQGGVKKRNTDGSFMTDTGIARSGTAGGDANNRDGKKNNGGSGSPQDMHKRIDKRRSYTVELGLLGLGDLDKNADNYAEKQEERIIQLLNMYKIEKQKQEELNEANRDLESQVAKNKTSIKNLQELVEELQKRLDSGENNKENLKRNDSRKVTVIDESRRKLGHSGTMQMSESSSAKNLMNLNDSTMDFLQQAGGFRSNISISATSALARKNQMLDKRNYAWQAMLMKAQKTIQAKSANSIVDTMPLKSLLKQITSFYAEKIQLAKDSPVTRDQDMATFVYKQFLHTYGFQHFAMRKFLKFMDSVKKYSNIHRVGLFARMLCIASDETNYQHDEVKQYLMATEYLMTNSTVGVYYPNADFDRRHFIAYVRAVEYSRVFGERRMPLEDILEIKRTIEARKMFDPTGRNPQGVVDMDEILEKIVEKYKELIEQNKEVLKPVFMAGDPYGSKGMVYIEFAMLYRTIEGEKHDEKKVEDAFASNCDVIVNGEIALSFEKFVRVCFDLDLFSKKALDSFLDVRNQEDLESKLNDLKVKWRKEKANLLELIDKNKPYVPQEVGLTWTSALIWVEDKLKMVESGVEKQVTMLKYKVLCKDLSN